MSKELSSFTKASTLEEKEPSLIGTTLHCLDIQTLLTSSIFMLIWRIGWMISPREIANRLERKLCEAPLSTRTKTGMSFITYANLIVDKVGLESLEIHLERERERLSFNRWFLSTSLTTSTWNTCPSSSSASPSARRSTRSPPSAHMWWGRVFDPTLETQCLPAPVILLLQSQMVCIWGSNRSKRFI